MKTEIYGTFGPACGSEEKLKQMIEAGMTGMRLNLSHTTLVASGDYIKSYQNAAKQMGVVPQILIDMQGPELRVGKLEAPMELQEGTQVLLCANGTYKEMCEALSADERKCLIPVPYQAFDAVVSDDEALLDDGKLLVRVIENPQQNEDANKESGSIMAQVIRGGVLYSQKSIKIIGKNVEMPALTEHDLANIKQARPYGVTALMQPFVLSGADLRYVRSVLKEHGLEDIKIFAKIENRLGVERLEDILPEADVIVIARGDLGNDMPLWELPRVQKEIEQACHKSGKPYIVVTQMLASMETNPVPTRAEVSDIFHAVFYGAYGIMVTGETAVGKYPVAAIQYLANTAKEAENFLGGNSNGSKS